MKLWAIEEFIPGGKQSRGFLPTDHIVWLRRNDGVSISINIASRGIAESEARELAQAMCDGMNAHYRNKEES